MEATSGEAPGQRSRGPLLPAGTTQTIPLCFRSCLSHVQNESSWRFFRVGEAHDEVEDVRAPVQRLLQIHDEIRFQHTAPRENVPEVHVGGRRDTAHDAGHEGAVPGVRLQQSSPGRPRAGPPGRLPRPATALASCPCPKSARYRRCRRARRRRCCRGRSPGRAQSPRTPPRGRWRRTGRPVSERSGRGSASRIPHRVPGRSPRATSGASLLPEK